MALNIRDLDLFIARAKIERVALDTDGAPVAPGAFRDDGERRHVAGLDSGDCLAGALAKTRGEPLLFKGADDFSSPDIVPAYGGRG